MRSEKNRKYMWMDQDQYDEKKMSWKYTGV